MPRPRMLRRVRAMPGASFFKPAGVRMAGMPLVVLTVEEYEAIRLMDHEGLKQTEAASRMGISQPTLQRVYESARRKVADALVNGKALKIEGGNYRLMARPRGGRGWGMRHGMG